MKNQYFGDIGDFGKYGLLREFAKRFPNYTLGINWYLTENDDRTDGKHIKYLAESSVLRQCDRNLFDFLKKCVDNNDRSVYEIEKSELLGNTIFYSDYLDYTQINSKMRSKYREEWFNNSVIKLRNARFIYVDPDNGIEVKSQDILGRNGIKYISLEEIKKYYNLGFSLIIYNHRDRKPHNIYIERFKQIQKSLDAKLLFLRFSRYSVRDYLFVLHRDVQDDTISFLHEFVNSSWKECFSIHTIET